MFDKIIEIGFLFDFYGKLLSERQYAIVEMYYIHDFSLSEIGEQLKISRQGVHDILKRAENLLYKFEDTLGLVKKFELNRKKAEGILEYIDLIKVEYPRQDDGRIILYLNRIQEFALEILEKGQEGK